VRVCGWPDEFVGQGTTRQLMQDHGLTPERLAQEVGVTSGLHLGRE
jgi:hypothetical protein